MTTIVSVRRNGKVVMGGDGQVSLGNTVMKGNAKKVRRLYHGQVLAGFAGATARSALSYGIKVQQDVLADGDGQAAMGGDYTGWAGFVAAGVTLLQTNFPDLLVPAVQKLRDTGTFPSEGPGKL